jgi:hypothetical protein
MKENTLKWCALFGLLLFAGVIFTPSLNADVVESKTTISVEETQFENLVGLVEEIISYYERTYGSLSDEDCGWNIRPRIEFPSPVICTLLFPIAFISWIGYFIPLVIFGPGEVGVIGEAFYVFMKAVGEYFNCIWSIV